MQRNDIKGRVRRYIPPVVRNREVRVKKAMEAQHKATIEVSEAMEHLEKAESQARDFVNKTKKRIAGQQQREHEILELCRESFEQFGRNENKNSASAAGAGALLW